MPSKTRLRRAAALSIQSLALPLSDVAIALLSYIAAVLLLLPIEAALYLSVEGGFERICLAAGTIVVLMFFHNLYPHVRIPSRVKLVLDLINVFGFAIVSQAFLAYAHVGLALPTSVMIGGSLLALPALTCSRLLLAAAFARDERILIVGATPTAREIALRVREHRELGLSVIGFVDDNPALEGGEKTLGRLAELKTIAAAAKPDRILLALSSPARCTAAEIAALHALGIRVQPCAALYEEIFGRVHVSSYGSPVASDGDPLRSRPVALAVQSIYTNLVALLAVLCSIPILLIVALAIKSSSKGRAISLQECIGLDGIPFQRARFRCHREHRNPDGSVERSLTWIGRLLMRCRLEGLPQCLNVLRGEMSLVGPEPERIEFSSVLSERIPAYSQRYTVKPGVIGWSQLNCDGEVLPDAVRRLEYDLYYARRISPVLDAIIVLHWAKAALKQLRFHPM